MVIKRELTQAALWIRWMLHPFLSSAEKVRWTGQLITLLNPN